jgi:site-specific DNA recombinase
MIERSNGKLTMTEKGNGKLAKLRCGIYTRKSTEEGLEQEFNSLDAQREAGEAFIQSQKHLGWECLPDHYDDGGFSGATMERPALQRLLDDIEAGKVDVVLVYKVDRLSRSLLDFARIIEAFDKRGISFVSVTQQFNTATSMGRLILNVLLSFAQFEREMIAERTRDKMAAARRKGKWVGGCPAFGYDVAPGGGKLIVNPEEAAQVREVFALYLQERSLLRVVEVLNGRGWRTKSWTTKTGKRHEGSPWEKSTLRKVLTNVTYIGKVDYKGEIYSGEHAGIVDPELFARVAEMLDAGRRDTRGRTRNKHGFLLRGLVRCVACKSVMTSSTSAPRGKPYRYYTCTEVNRRGRKECSVRSVPAEELERFVVARISEMGADPSLLRDTLEAVAADRQRNKPELEREQRQLQVEHQACRGEAKQLVAALATQTGGDGRSIIERLAELDQRAGQIEKRLTEIQEALAAIDRTTVKPADVASALSLFNPVWEALTPRERANLLHILIDGVEYDGQAKEVAITLRPTGVASLAREAEGASAAATATGSAA